MRLLYTDGRPSALATTMSEQFTEIAVDEYQDTNAVQDAIFRALSRDETNLFMVGDVKQSIYGCLLYTSCIERTHAVACRLLTCKCLAQCGERRDCPFAECVQLGKLCLRVLVDGQTVAVRMLGPDVYKRQAACVPSGSTARA